MNKILKPKKTKYKKQQRRSFRKEQKNFNLKGDYAIMALDNFWFSSNQIEACRKTILRYTKRIGKILFNVFPDKPISKKTAGSRMGSGKGSVSNWVTPIRKGKLLIEIKNIPSNIAKKALNQVSYKLPVRTKIYEKNRNSFTKGKK